MCVHFSKIAKVFFFYNGVEYYLFRVNDCACFDASRVVNISADCCITDIPIYETTDVKIMCNYIVLTMCSLLGCEGVKGKKDHGLIKKSFLIFIRPSLDGTYYGMALSVRPSVRPTFSTKKHRCKWRIFFKFCTLVCFGVPSINLLFVLSYLIKYAHNSIISDFSIFGFHRVIF